MAFFWNSFFNQSHPLNPFRLLQHLGVWVRPSVGLKCLRIEIVGRRTE